MSTTQRVALSPKKLRSSNILPTPACPTSPSKRARALPYSLDDSPRRARSPDARQHGSSPLRSSVPTSARRSPRLASPVKQLSPFKVFSDDAVYATHLDEQIAGNRDLVLRPPGAPRVSPSPRKKGSPRQMTDRSTRARPACQLLAESTRVQARHGADPLAPARLAFLTPPRPRLSFDSREARLAEDRISKSASPKLGRSGLGRLDAVRGFTIYVDSCEYFSLVDTDHELGEGVNKENRWLAKHGITA